MPGSFALGDDECGDELPALAASAVITPPDALFFDPMTRRHEILADGTYRSIHPVDATVIHCVHIARGKFLSERNTGAGFWLIRSGHDPRAQRKAEDYAKQALAGPLSRGDIKLHSVTLEIVGAYTTGITVSYTNLRLWPFKTKPAQFSFAAAA